MLLLLCRLWKLIGDNFHVGWSFYFVFIFKGIFIPGFPKLLRFQGHHDQLMKKFFRKVRKHLVIKCLYFYNLTFALVQCFEFYDAAEAGKFVGKFFHQCISLKEIFLHWTSIRKKWLHLENAKLVTPFSCWSSFASRQWVIMR